MTDAIGRALRAVRATRTEFFLAAFSDEIGHLLNRADANAGVVWTEVIQRSEEFLSEFYAGHPDLSKARAHLAVEESKRLAIRRAAQGHVGNGRAQTNDRAGATATPSMHRCARAT